MIHLIHGKNLYKCFNVPTPSTTTTTKKWNEKQINKQIYLLFFSLILMAPVTGVWDTSILASLGEDNTMMLNRSQPWAPFWLERIIKSTNRKLACSLTRV
jgi:hypothetical protein